MTELEIQKILSLSENDLLLELGKLSDNAKTTIGWRPPTDWQFWEWGKEWFKNNEKKIREKVCNDPKVCLLIQHSDTIDDLHLCILIIDVIKDIFGILHIPFIAALLVKKGIIAFCKK